MSMSLVTISNAAFADAKDIDNKEAVEVMNALGVLVGDDKGNFNADANLTRAQAAKIICAILLGQTAADNLNLTASFSDASGWAESYIAYCASQGIVAGVGDGKFDPNGQLTGYQFAKMLFVALGYDASLESMTGADWQVNVAKLALSAGLNKDLDISLSKVLTRDEAAQMAFNTLTATLVTYSNGVNVSTSDGTKVTVDSSRYKVGDASESAADSYSYRQFSRAIAAGYVLSALWSRSFGAVTIDGRLIREKRYIGWLNYVLGTQYSNERATRPDEMLRLLHEAEMEGGNDLTVLLRDVPAECMDYAALRVFFAADIWARPGKQNPVTEEQMAAFLKDRTIEPSLTLSDYISHALRRFRDSGGTLEEAEVLLRMTSEQRRALYDADRTNLLPLTYEREHTVLAAAQTAVEFGADFWELWGRVEDCVPIGNEDGPAPTPCPPEEPVSTQEFFGLEAEQLAYYWTPESGIRFSDEMTAWMAALRTELESITEEIVPEEFLRTLVEAIAETETAFFRDAFYELIARQRERRVQSAVLLMRRLAEREGEEKLSRYSAILGNPALRQEAFGF